MSDRETRADDVSAYKRIEPGDVVLNRMRAFQGAVGTSHVAGLVTPEYMVLRATHAADARFVGYLVKSNWFVAEMSSRLRGIGTAEQGNVRTPRIYWSELGAIDLTVPDIGEQRAIADFLDCETARIDGVESRRRRLIELLRERRVETRRVAFDGAPAARQRLPWLPPIPIDWDILPLRWVADCLDGRRVPLNSEHRSTMLGDIPYWGANGVVDWVDDYLFDEELVLLGEDGAPFFERQRDVAFSVTGRVWVNNHIHVLRPKRVRARFLAHYLNLVDYSNHITGTTRDKLTQDEMGSIPVPVPSKSQQIAIEERIDEGFALVNALLSKVQQQVQLLHEHRQALVTAAVTGQMEVVKRADQPVSS